MTTGDAGPDSRQYVMLGRVVKPHGLKGEIKVFPYSGQPDDFKLYRKLVLVDSDKGESRTFVVARSRSQARVAILLLNGLGGIEEAEMLRGWEIWISREELLPLEPDTFYWHDLAGLEVVTDAGRELGTVSSMLTAGPQPLLVVTGRGREYLIPARKEFIVQVDRTNRKLVVSPVPGLLEMND